MRHTDALINELQAYRHSTTEHGNDTYAAAGGEHDDLVIALSLALWTAEHQRPPYPCRRGIFNPNNYGRIPTSDEIVFDHWSRLYTWSPNP
jgi:hypothetical protein